MRSGEVAAELLGDEVSEDRLNSSLHDLTMQGEAG
jgi:hypothetical protein